MSRHGGAAGAGAERVPAPSTARRAHLPVLSGLERVERRALLQKYLAKAGPALHFSEHMDGPDGEAMFRHACRLGLEGIVSKKLAAPYLSGRCRSWRKVKNPTYRRRGELSQAA